MPVPAYPYNRHEQYLNRIATGEGDIPPYPQNREEQYLAAIVDNGGGGGGTGGGVFVNMTWDDATQSYSLDKTAGELYDAILSGAVIYCKDTTSIYLVVWVNTEDGYGFGLDSSTALVFGAASANDYPVSNL